MTDYVLDIAESGARLSVENRLLVIDPPGGEITRVPLREIAAVIVSHPRVSYTHAVLTGLAEAKATFITCDERRRPASMLLPLVAHSTQAERFQLQAASSRPTRKRLWKQIVQAKVRSQAALLREVTGDDAGLTALVSEVRSGDPGNVEALAAQRYWPRLFGDPDFRRDRDAADHNQLLNYGYAIARGAVARALCGVGLHPTLGVHHHGRYNPFALADDVMEPFRSWVDAAVVTLVATGAYAVTGETRGPLIEAITQRRVVEEESRTGLDVIRRSVRSVAHVLLEGRGRFWSPWS